jgi:NAD-dependent SIR2 family protein deacetylase
VDGHFDQAGFAAERIVECHGSLEWLQCLAGCGTPLFATAGHQVVVDPVTFRATGTLPACPSCGGLARPNVLMFGDWAWDSSRTSAQESRLESWRRAIRSRSRLVVVECGAGTAVPTVRAFSERLMRAHGATLVRINLREAHVPRGAIAIAMGAREALGEIDARIPAR